VNSLPDNAVVVSGGCRGVDAWAADAAHSRSLHVIEFHPDFTDFNKLTYPQKCARYYARNRRIAENSDIIHAFVAPDRRGGTENTIYHARELGVPVVIHQPADGSVQSSDEK